MRPDIAPGSTTFSEIYLAAVETLHEEIAAVLEPVPAEALRTEEA